MYPNSTLLGPSKSGSVYRSTHPQSGQPVLVKLMPWDASAPAALDTEIVTRLAPQLSQINGYHIARLIGLEQWDTGLGVVSEFCNGPTLSQHPQKGTIAPKEALDIANQLLQALCDGERLRLIHGDIKPSNVIVGMLADGRPLVKLTDWGLNQARATPPMESILFSAPERLDGSPATLRGDLFSLGHVLFFLLTGMTLVKGRTVAEISAAWDTAAPDHLKKIRKDLPPKFIKFLLTLLEKKTDKRPANPSAARTLLAELSPPALPKPPLAPRSTVASTAAPSRPIAAATSTVAVQGPMQPPGTTQPSTSSVPVVAMRPPPEIAAQLNLPPMPLAPVYAAPAQVMNSGSYTQPFVTGTPQAVPVGVRTQPIPQHHGTATPRQQSQRANQHRGQPVPEAKSRAPIYLVLTIVVLISAGVTGFLIWKNLDKSNQKESPSTTPAESTDDLKARIRGGN